MAALQILQARPRQRQEIDTVMAAKAAVFVGLQKRDEARVHLPRRDRQQPAPVGGREGAQQAAVAVDGDRRDAFGGGEIERTERCPQGEPCPGNAETEDGATSAAPAKPAPRSC